MGRITRITKNVRCTWPKRGRDEYYGEVYVMTYLTENAIELMEQL